MVAPAQPRRRAPRLPRSSPRRFSVIITLASRQRRLRARAENTTQHHFSPRRCAESTARLVFNNRTPRAGFIFRLKWCVTLNCCKAGGTFRLPARRHVCEGRRTLLTRACLKNPQVSKVKSGLYKTRPRSAKRLGPRSPSGMC